MQGEKIWRGMGEVVVGVREEGRRGGDCQGGEAERKKGFVVMEDGRGHSRL